MSAVATLSAQVDVLLETLRKIALIPRQKKQGRHLDPLQLQPPVISDWSERRRAAWTSSEMEVFRDCLRSGDLDVRQSILSELSRFYGYSIEECYVRCIEWETWSVNEWRARERNSPEGLQDFYDTVQSWSFDLLWYSYLQAQGFGYPAAVLAVKYALERCPRGDHLDFGSGIGLTSQLFSRCGFASTAADISKPLLAFASWRIDEHGDQVQFINLADTKLPTAAFDIVTAVDTLVHVRELDEALRDLHRAIRPGGWLLTNFDVRDSDAVESASHLHNDLVALEHRLERTGFRRTETLAGVTQVYQRIDPTTFVFRVRLWLLTLLLPARKLAALLNRMRWPTPKRILSLITGSHQQK